MNSTSVRKVAQLLNGMVLITFICNIIVLPVVLPLVFWEANLLQLAAKQTLAGN